METKRHYISVPAPVIRKLDAILSVHLKRAHEYLRACHSFIQFIDDEPMENEEVRFHSPKDLLWLNPARLRVVVLFPKRGLTRYVAERDRPAFWPHSETAECYEPANPDVTSEIAGPIHFHNRVAGVVLFDRIEPEPRFGKTEIAYLETLLERIDAEIRDHEKDVRDALSRIAEKSCEETKSTRGYIAVRQWGGVLEYFYAGKDWERFLKLSVGEGFAGKVFRSNDVELPGHEVLDEQSYIISDESIQSQIAGPISDGDDVIGVINLESFQRHAYNEETKERVRAYALEAKEWAMRYRELDDDLGNASAALLESCTTVIDSFRDQGSAANRRAEESVRALLRGQVLRLPMAGECGFWMGEKSLRPGILPEGIQWERVEREADCAGGNTPAIWIVWAPLFVEGRIDSVCLVEVPASHASSFVLALKALCAIASGAMRQLRSRYRIKLYHELTYFLIENPDTEAGLQRTVRDVKEIFESDHCTLFVRMGKYLCRPFRRRRSSMCRGRLTVIGQRRALA